MIRSRLWPTVGLVLILVAADGAAQTGAVKPSDVSPFMGTWVLTMTNPEGTEQIVRIWDKKGASLQVCRLRNSRRTTSPAS